MKTPAPTQKQKKQHAVPENERMLRTFGNNLPEGLVYQIESSRDGKQRRFTYISDRVQALHGVSAAAVLKDAGLLYAQVDEEDRREVVRREAVALKTLSPLSVEVRVTLPSGEKRWRLFTSAPRCMAGGRLIWDGIELDITQHKMMEARFRSTIESSPAGMHFYRLETENRLVFIGANPAADRLLAVDHAQFIGKTIEEAFPLLVGTKVPERYRHVAATGERWETDEIVYDHGSIQGAYSVIAFQIEPRHMVAMFFDITDRKRAEEVHRRVRILESLETVAGGIAHDFNNLLTGVFGNIELAQQDLPPGHPSAAALRSAHQALDNARRLTARLLTFAKGGQPALEEVDLRQRICETVRFHLAGSHVAARFDIPADLWPAKADKGLIDEVISNLTLNAREAMPSGGTIHIQARNVHDPRTEGAPELHGDCVTLVFRDEGVGIPESLLGRIFEPYFTTKQAGSGLGLAIVHKIIQDHHGHISVESILGVGTTFTILLPANAAPAPQRASPSPVATVPPARRHPRMRILLMDDEEVIRITVPRMLERLGHTVETAVDGSEAVARYAAALQSGSPFNLAILDLTVPGGMGGKEGARKLLALDPSARIVVSSGYSSDAVVADYARHGFCGRLTKPFSVQELEKALAQALDAAARPQQN